MIVHLNHLKIENFKSLQNIEFNPKKITILIGPNSSGKSSILQLLAIIRQSIASSQSQGYFRSNGEIIDLGTFSDIVFDHDDSKNIRINTGGDIFLNKEYDRVFGPGSGKFSYRFTVGKEGVESVYCKLNQGSSELVVETLKGNLQIGRFSILKGSGKLRIQNSNNLLQGVSVSEAPGNTEEESRLINKLFQNADFTKELFKNYYYIPPSRTMDEYGLPIVNVYDNEFVTSKGQKSNLSRLVSYLSSSPPRVTNMISEWTEKLFGKKIKTKTVPTYEDNKPVTNVTIEFLEDQHYNAIVNDGSGTNQVILLLTLLGITPPHSILGIEEPEIHLHPKAQADLAKILIDVSLRDNKQILFTTHSEHMLYPFLTSIASKSETSLKLSDLGIFYFEKDVNTHSTKVTPLEVDENGMISGGLKGFFEAEIASLKDYLKAVENE